MAHGTLACARAGCLLKECRAKLPEAERQPNKGGRPHKLGPAPERMVLMSAPQLRSMPFAPLMPLPVTCWCERVIVTATAEEIWTGRTRGCGLSSCGPWLLARARVA